MKKSSFLHEVRELIDNKQPDSLKRLFVEVSRYIPRDACDDVLALLSKPSEVPIYDFGKDLLSSTQVLCERVRNGEYELSFEYEEGNYRGYWSDDLMLVDQNGLGEQIEALLKAALHTFVEKRYAEAFQVFDELYTLEIPCKNNDDIDISSFFSSGTIGLDKLEVLRCYAYTALMVLRGNERIEKLFKIVRRKIDIHDIVSVGMDEIPERDEFSHLWVEYLMKQESRYYHEMLVSAVRFRDAEIPDTVVTRTHSEVFDLDEEDELLKICQWMTDRGLPSGELYYEAVDENGENAIVIDLAFPTGIQSGLTEPVALMLNEEPDKIGRASNNGYKVFLSTESFIEHMEAQYANVG